MDGKNEYKVRHFGPFHTYKNLKRDLIITGMLIVALIVLKVVS